MEEHQQIIVCREIPEAIDSKGAILKRWFKPDGALVHLEDVVALLQSRLASVEIVAEHSGRLRHNVAVGTAVKAGDVLGRVT